jgi:hypothetical protein
MAPPGFSRFPCDALRQGSVKPDNGFRIHHADDTALFGDGDAASGDRIQRPRAPYWTAATTAGAGFHAGPTRASRVTGDPSCIQT